MSQLAYGWWSQCLHLNLRRNTAVAVTSFGVLNLMLIGPTRLSWASIAAEVQPDLARLARPGLSITYRCTGDGPAEVRTRKDAEDAAPHVVRTALAAEREGFDGIVVDCTGDPGVLEAGRVVEIPVVGPGQALREVVARSQAPVCELSGDALRSLDIVEILRRVGAAKTVVLGGTGFSHLVDVMAEHRPGAVVLDPLAVAVDACLDRLKIS